MLILSNLLSHTYYGKYNRTFIPQLPLNKLNDKTLETVIYNVL